jgi:hypothetical protein
MSKHVLTNDDITKFMTENYPSVHASEYSWHGQDFDAVFDNSGTVEDLMQSVDLKIGNQARAA